MNVILSGMQPSGMMHLGNYIGSICNYNSVVKKISSSDTECFFMIADLHTLNITPDPVTLRNNNLDLISCLLACDVSSDYIFKQSSIPYHSYLSTILSVFTPLGMLNRMTQFKDKIINKSLKEDSVNSGLLFYPILQAADILLYDVNFVPVGSDQKQHLELVRYLAKKFNDHYKEDVFVVPKAIIPDSDSKRIMSLSNPVKKMSKSDQNLKSCIYMNDSNDDIAMKIKKSQTDSIQGIYHDKQNRPGISNLLDIFSSLSGKSIESLTELYGNYSIKDFKSEVTDLLVEKIAPIREKISLYKNDSQLLESRTKQGTEFACQKAKLTIERVKKVIGL